MTTLFEMSTAFGVRMETLRTIVRMYMHDGSCPSAALTLPSDVNVTLTLPHPGPGKNSSHPDKIRPSLLLQHKAAQGSHCR